MWYIVKDSTGRGRKPVDQVRRNKRFGYEAIMYWIRKRENWILGNESGNWIPLSFNSQTVTLRHTIVGSSVPQRWYSDARRAGTGAGCVPVLSDNSAWLWCHRIWRCSVTWFHRTLRWPQGYPNRQMALLYSCYWQNEFDYQQTGFLAFRQY